MGYNVPVLSATGWKTGRQYMTLVTVVSMKTATLRNAVKPVRGAAARKVIEVYIDIKGVIQKMPFLHGTLWNTWYHSAAFRNGSYGRRAQCTSHSTFYCLCCTLLYSSLRKTYCSWILLGKSLQFSYSYKPIHSILFYHCFLFPVCVHAMSEHSYILVRAFSHRSLLMIFSVAYLSLQSFSSYTYLLLWLSFLIIYDFYRWCREGHIPFLSAQYLLPASMPLCYSDKVIFKSNKRVPSVERVQELTGNLALFLNIQKIPLPPVEDVLTKLIKTLNLPGSLAL